MRLQDILRGAVTAPPLAESISVNIGGRAYTVGIENEQFVITTPDAKRYTYSLRTPGFIAMTIPVLDIVQSGAQYMLKYRHPLTRSVSQSNVPVEKLNFLLSKIGVAKVPVEIRTASGESQELEFVKS